MKNGDFSALPTVIYDPTSLHLVNGVLTRNPFPGNIIPANQISAVGQNVLALYPNPNTPGTSAANGLYTSSPTKRDDFDQFTVRVDHRFNDKNNIFGRYSFSKENRFDTFDSFCAGANNVPGFGCNTLNGGQQVVLDYIWLISANKVNEARTSFTRVRGGIFQQNEGNDVATKLGILGTGRNPEDFGVPVITATGYDRIGEATNLPQDRHDNTYEWADSLSWTTGRHSIKFGTEIRRFQENFLFDSSARGTLNFHAVLYGAGGDDGGGGGERGGRDRQRDRGFAVGRCRYGEREPLIRGNQREHGGGSAADVVQLLRAGRLPGAAEFDGKCRAAMGVQRADDRQV